MVKDTSGKEVEWERKDLSGEDGIKIVKYALRRPRTIEIGASYISYTYALMDTNDKEVAKNAI